MDIDKNSHEIIRVERSDYHGYDLVAIRVWVKVIGDKGTIELRPTKKGITFAARLLPSIIDGLGAIHDDLRVAQIDAECLEADELAKEPKDEGFQKPSGNPQVPDGI